MVSTSTDNFKKLLDLYFIIILKTQLLLFSFGNLTATPYVTETDLSECGHCAMLILACDGVWDVFTDQEAAELLLEKYTAEGPFEDAANMLVTFQ